MMLIRSIRGLSSNRAMTWMACAPLALIGLGITTVMNRIERALLAWQ